MRELWWTRGVALSRPMWDVARATGRTVHGMSSVVCGDIVWALNVSPPSTHVRIRSPHLGERALPLFLLRSAACHVEFFEIAFRVLGTGGRDLVGAFAVEAAGDATAWIGALDGLRGVWKDTVALGTLVVIRRGPTGWECRGLWFSRNWGRMISRHVGGSVFGVGVRTKDHVGSSVWFGRGRGEGWVCLYLGLCAYERDGSAWGRAAGHALKSCQCDEVTCTAGGEHCRSLGWCSSEFVV